MKEKRITQKSDIFVIKEIYMLETFNVLRIDEPDFGCEGVRTGWK